MKAFAGLAVTAGLIVAIPVANAQTSARHDAGKTRHHAASHSYKPYFVTSLQTALRHLLQAQASMPRGAKANTADATSGPPGESAGTLGKENPPKPQILPTQDMPAVQGLE
jgi:hypothetical protein